MAFSRSRIRFIALFALGAFFLVFLLGWFVLAPKLIAAKLDNVLAEVSVKTQRTVSYERARLSSPKSLTLDGIVISDVGAPASKGISIRSVTISLDRLPLGTDFRVAHIDISTVDVAFHHANGQTNFDDVLDLLRPRDAEPKTPSQPKAWRRYITPMPSVHIDAIHVLTTPIAFHSDLSLLAVSAKNASFRTTADGGYALTANVAAELNESGHATVYASELQGNLKNGREGSVTLTLPKSQQGTSPKALQLAGHNATFEKILWELPTAFEIFAPKLTHLDATLFEAKSARINLMALPPKKVSGVYFKEIELIEPNIHIVIGDEDLALTGLIQEAKKTWLKQDPPADAASAPPVEAADAPPPRHVKDLFFSQRFFITHASIDIVDQRKSATSDLRIDNLTLELGYRSIRKIVDLQLDIQTSIPLSLSAELSARYGLKTEDIEGKFVIHEGTVLDTTKAWQARIQQRLKEDPGNVSGFERLIAFLNMEGASGQGSIAFEGNLSNESLRTWGSISSRGFALFSEAISPIPLSLEGGLAFDVTVADFAMPKLTLHTFDIDMEGVVTSLRGTLAREELAQPRRGRNPQRIDTVRTITYDLVLSLPKTQAQTVLLSIPHAFRPNLDGLSFAGNISLELSVKGNLASVADTQHNFSLVLSDDFAVTAWPANRNIANLSKGFIHTVRDPNALQEHRISVPPSIYPIHKTNPARRNDIIILYNPGLVADDIRMTHPNWVLFEDLNPWLIQLITTTEDGSFFTHTGFSPLQIKAALAKNLQRGEFNRGASTISMQLIKNLFFDRNKALSRKFEEMLYTWLMESVVMIPKQRILELYFNIIEFGPEIYGIEEAAKYYFGKRSQALTLKESAFLMAIIPSPRKGALYRQAQSDRAVQKTMAFYIQEMHRRKCNSETLASLRARYAKRGQPLPFEPCCPPADSLELMKNEALAFHIPNPKDPTQYEYRPDLYTARGTPLIPVRRSSCGYHSGASVESIFDALMPEQMPVKELGDER
ncbi:MAG: transglycosylase domain-containing protein [Proteobacteria bacterium]|nr:transglycosylase domain-containing protein [Pseudomonadota bacterium]